MEARKPTRYGCQEEGKSQRSDRRDCCHLQASWIGALRNVLHLPSPAASHTKIVCCCGACHDLHKESLRCLALHAISLRSRKSVHTLQQRGQHMDSVCYSSGGCPRSGLITELYHRNVKFPPDVSSAIWIPGVVAGLVGRQVS